MNDSPPQPSTELDPKDESTGTSGPPPVLTEDDTQVIRRGDRYPPNLFLITVPGMVVFPDLTVPVVLQEGWAERTVTQAQSQSEFIGFAVRRDPGGEDAPPSPEDLYPFGCLGRVLRTLQMPDGTRTLLLQGVRRFQIRRFLRKRPYLIAKVEYPEEVLATDDESEAVARNVRKLLGQIIQDTPEAGEEMGIAALNIDRKGALVDFAASYFVKDPGHRAGLLAELDVKKRLFLVHEELLRERHFLDLGQRLEEEIRERIEERQREFFLREQIKAIRRELGEETDERTLDLEAFRKQLDERDLPEVIQARAEEDLRRLGLLATESPEYAVVRGSLEWLLGLPFGIETEDTRSLPAAERILNRDHAGLDEIKERILEFLAVRQRVPAHKGQILCFSGPPGVGKTSLGRSIADALGRRFVRLSLGGVHDEAEIRGHRRTYVGAMPGRIVRGLKTAESMNPVFVLDELDKIGQDFRGDPSAALLEVLDPEQNHSFSDHYLEVPIDLSRVFFIATANQVDAIPPALRDRLEVIEMSGYVTEEKLAIASGFLIPRQLEHHGLKRRDLTLRPAAVRKIVEEYTREAGVRALEQLLARICRKAVRRLQGSRKVRSVAISVRNLADYLGPPRHPPERRARKLKPGIAVGLAWTPVGGELLEIQIQRIPGAKKDLQVTGRLGEVMSESARIARSYVASHQGLLEVPSPDDPDGGLHIHVPAGAVPKDGPSAGITLTTALVSLLRETPVRPGIAMTGEITLTGQVLPVGGVRDKILAARRYGLSEVILPADNRNDVTEIRPDLVKGMTFHFVEEYREVLPLVFETRRATRTRSDRGRNKGNRKAKARSKA